MELILLFSLMCLPLTSNGGKTMNLYSLAFDLPQLFGSVGDIDMLPLICTEIFAILHILDILRNQLK